MLRFTQAIEFNDPFEMQPFLKGLTDEATIKAQFDGRFQKNVEAGINDRLSKLTPKQRSAVDMNALSKLVEQQTPAALEMFKKFMDGMTPIVNRQIYQTVSEKLGVLCLTEKPTNLLMWAHYADHHRGVVVEFDADHAFFNCRRGPTDDFRHFRKVVYTKQRPALLLKDSEAINFFYFKSVDWEYEQEWRLIFSLADSSKQIDREGRYPICLFETPPECIQSIIFGCRCSDNQRFELTKLVRAEPAFRHVSFEQAELDPEIFAIQRRLVAPDALDKWIALKTTLASST